MKLLGMLGRRLMQVAVTVVLVSLLVFGLMHLLPGDPALMLLVSAAATKAWRPCAGRWGWTSRSRCSSGSS